MSHNFEDFKVIKIASQSQKPAGGLIAAEAAKEALKWKLKVMFVESSSKDLWLLLQWFAAFVHGHMPRLRVCVLAKSGLP